MDSNIIVVLVIDISGIVGSLENGISRILKGKFILGKPWSCSVCMSFWIGLTYLLWTGNLNLISIFLVLLFSNLSEVGYALVIFIKDALKRFIDFLYLILKI